MQPVSQPPAPQFFTSHPKMPPFVVKYTEVENPKERALLRLCQGENITRVKEWLSNNTSRLPLNFCTAEKITPLMIASFYGNIKIFRIILDNSLPENINQINNEDRNALHYACVSNNSKIREILFKECQMPMLKDVFGFYAGEYLHATQAIDHELHQETQNLLNNEASILKKAYDKAGGDLEKMKTILEPLGRMRITSGPSRVCQPKDEKEVADLQKERQAKIQSTTEQRKIAQYLIERPLSTVDDATRFVSLKYGIKATEQSISNFLDYAKRQRIKIVNDLTEHPQMNEKLAIQRVEERYGFKLTTSGMKALIAEAVLQRREAKA